MQNAIDLFAAFSLQLFIVVDPLAGIPVFLAITPRNTPQERREMARRGCLVAFLVVSFFLLFGPVMLRYFGIGTPAVRICGGILLFVIALEMLYGRFTGTGTSRREERLAEVKEDISITPLAIPLLAGPGAIATSLIFSARTENWFSVPILLAASAFVFFLSKFLLQRADRIVGLLGNLGTTILTRIMGLVLAFLSVQYVIDGLEKVFRLD